MQAKLRRVLAVLGVLAMLCTLLPMGIVSVSAAGTIANADFEEGAVGTLPTSWKSYKTDYQSYVYDGDAHSGSHSAILAWRNQRFVLYQDVAVDTNTTYTVEFWYRSLRTSSSQGTTVKYTFGAYNTSAKGNVAGSGGEYIDSAATEVLTDYHNGSWTKVTYTFNSGSNTTVRLGFAGESSSSTFTADQGMTLVDDLSMTGVANEPEQPGEGGEEQGEAIYTQDYESGLGT